MTPNLVTKHVRLGSERMPSRVEFPHVEDGHQPHRDGNVSVPSILRVPRSDAQLPPLGVEVLELETEQLTFAAPRFECRHTQAVQPW